MRKIAEGWFHAYIQAPEHIKEQALLRMELCKECVGLGKCVHCGCKSPALFYSPTKEDALGRWGRMLGKEEWEYIKTQAKLDDDGYSAE